MTSPHDELPSEPADNNWMSGIPQNRELRAARKQWRHEDARFHFVEPAEAAWQTGLFGCGSDWRSCVEVILCYHCTSCRLLNVISDDSQFNVLELMDMVIFFIFDAVSAGLCSGYYACRTRKYCRKRYAIPPAVCEHEDILVACVFCRPCSMCQVHRESSMRGWWPGSCCSTTPLRMPVRDPGAPLEMV
jgi:Cys-rich protein (TIGR01571 family)